MARGKIIVNSIGIWGSVAISELRAKVFEMSSAGGVMRRIAILVLLGFIGFPKPGWSAVITLMPRDDIGFAMVEIVGDIKPGDGAAFKSKISNYKNVMVTFDSMGGAIADAIEIGETMHERHFQAVVPNYKNCMSACAYAWLGGGIRILGTTVKLGFHDIYNIDKKGNTEISASGNAILGAYLGKIGIPSKLIEIMTTPGPKDLVLINGDELRANGVTVQPLFVNPDEEGYTQVAVYDKPKETVWYVARELKFGYEGSGLAGVNDIIRQCYAATSKSHRRDDAVHCVALDAVGFMADEAMAKNAGLPSTPFNLAGEFHRRAVRAAQDARTELPGLLQEGIAIAYAAFNTVGPTLVSKDPRQQASFKDSKETDRAYEAMGPSLDEAEVFYEELKQFSKN